MKTHACTRATPCVNEVKPEVFTQKAKLLFCNPTFYWESTNHVKMEGKQREVFTFYYTAPDILPDGVCFYFPRDFSGTFSCYFPIYRCTVSQYNQETGFTLKNKQLPPKSSLHCIALNLILLHAFASLALVRKTPLLYYLILFQSKIDKKCHTNDLSISSMYFFKISDCQKNQMDKKFGIFSHPK